MNRIQPVAQSDIKLRIKEAEVCHSMGMLREALQVYEQMIAGLSAMLHDKRRCWQYPPCLAPPRRIHGLRHLFSFHDVFRIWLQPLVFPDMHALFHPRPTLR
jgi:hypothetical protein